MSTVAALVFSGVALALLLAWLLRKPKNVLISVGVVSPFEGFLASVLGATSHVISPIIVLSFLVHGQLRDSIKPMKAVAGTKIQVIALVGICGSAAASIYAWPWTSSTDLALELGQKLSLYLIASVVGYLLVPPGRLRLLLKCLVASSLAYVALSAAVLFLVPDSGNEFARVLLSRELIGYGELNIHRYRAAGLGLPLNRFANALILPFFASIGLVLDQRSKPRTRTLAIAAVIILGLGLIGAASRAALAGVTVGVVALIFLVARRGYSLPSVGGIGRIVVSVLIVAAIVWQTGLLDLLIARLEPSGTSLADLFEWQERHRPWEVALALFRESPVFGTGPTYFSQVAMLEYGLPPAFADPHNGFLHLLVTGGLIQAVPYIVVFVLVTVTLAGGGRVARDLVGSRVLVSCVFAAWLALLVNSMFHSYEFTRWPWLCVGVAIALVRRVQSRALS